MWGYRYRFCKWCGHEIYPCPSNCRHGGWKHMDDGKHVCERVTYQSRAVWSYLKLYAYPLTIQRTEHE